MGEMRNYCVSSILIDLFKFILVEGIVTTLNSGFHARLVRSVS